MTCSNKKVPSRVRPTRLLLAILLAATLPVAVEASSPATVRIAVSAAAGSPSSAAPGSPYVALVPETSPWSHPLKETVLTDSSEISWQVPAGRYRVVAGAPGFSLEYRPPFDLAEGASRTEGVQLTRLVPVEGRVVASGEGGAPIAGATVSPLRNLVLGFPGQLSELGERHLAGNFEAATDDDGRFRMLLQPRVGYVVAVRAEGWTPRFLGNVRLPASAEDLRSIELSPGASLAVGWSVPPAAGGGAGGYDRLQLVPLDKRYPEPLGLNGVLAVWARPLGGAGSFGTATWPSLPPGRYEVWSKAPPSGAHSLVPRRLARVTLAPGASETLTVDIPQAPPGGAAAAAGKGAEDLEILLPEMPRPELETLRVRTWPEGARSAGEGAGGRDLRFRAEAVSGGTLLRLPAACREGAELTLATSKRVGALGPIDLARPHACAGAPGTHRRLALFPRSDLALSVRSEAGSSLPAGGELTVRPCAQVRADPTAPRLAMGVPVVLPEAKGEEKPAPGPGKVETPVPAGCVDLTLRVGEFAPLTWHDLNLEAGKSKDLGDFQLRLGAALLVRVLSAQDGRALAGVKVSAVETDAVEEVVRAAGAALSGIPGGAERARTALQGPATGRDGWVRLYGLPTGGRLTVLLLGPGRHLPELSREVQLSPGEERVLDDLELGPPAALTVQVELSSELEDDGAEPYEVYLDRADPATPRLSLSQHIPPDGRVRFEELLPGKWRLMGLVRVADGRPFPGGSDEVVVAPGADSSIRLELGNRVFRGRVTFEGTPVEGYMNLRPLSPPDRNGMNVRLDERGEFRVPLEGPGTYTVRVSSLHRKRLPDAVVPEIRFEDPDDPVEIRLPEGQIAGVVVDKEGRPVPGAKVKSQSNLPVEEGERFREMHRLDRSSLQGDFTIKALPPGTWTLIAEAENGESLPRTFDLAADQHVGGVRLVVEDRTDLHGRVVDILGQPVPGALLLITPHTEAAGEIPERIQATTDGLGRFTAATVLTGRLANVQVVEPDGSATAVLVELTKETLVQLPALSAPAAISLPCAKRPVGTSGVYVLVSRDGAYIVLLGVGQTAHESDSPCRFTQTIPALSAGLWHLVRLDTVAEGSMLASGAGFQLPSRGELRAAPGTVARVRVEPEGSAKLISE